MILVDANLLIYSVNQDLPQHKQARAWWEQTLSGTETVGIPWVSILAFLRICTNPRIFSQPLSPESAMAYLDEWLGQPLVGPVAGTSLLQEKQSQQPFTRPVKRIWPIWTGSRRLSRYRVHLAPRHCIK